MQPQAGDGARQMALGIQHGHRGRVDGVQQVAADAGVAALAGGLPLPAQRAGGVARRFVRVQRPGGVMAPGRVGGLAQQRVPFGQRAGQGQGFGQPGGIDPPRGAVEQRQHRTHPHVDGHRQPRVAPLHDGGAVLAPDRNEHRLADGRAQAVQATRRQFHEIHVGQGRQARMKRLRAEAVAGAGGILFDVAAPFQRYEIAVHLRPGHVQAAPQFRHGQGAPQIGQPGQDVEGGFGGLDPGAAVC
ncbi:hypothetical protein D9M68_587800 [compost metagenome]